jgi:hypothetical protein
MMGDALSGLDDCDLAMVCWNVDDQGHGICIGLAEGPPDSPTCADPTTILSLCQDCLFGYCLPGCNPLLADCPDGKVCIPVTNNDVGFACVLDASGDAGQVNDPCSFVNGCDPGLVCQSPSTASSTCDPQASGCCQPYCTFPDSPCPNPDQQCVQWFDPMLPVPPGGEDIGACAVPP